MMIVLDRKEGFGKVWHKHPCNWTVKPPHPAVPTEKIMGKKVNFFFESSSDSSAFSGSKGNEKV